MAAPQVLLVGGTGRTGRRVVQQLLQRGVAIRALVRSARRLPEDLAGHPALVVVEADLLSLGAEDLLEQVTGPAMVYGDGRGNDGTKTGLSHQEFNALLKNRIAAARTAIAKAKGECHE